MNNHSLLFNVNDILVWATRRSAESELPWLLSRLIRAVDPSARIQAIRQDKGVVFKGWDGIVDSSQGSSYLSAGRSLWEFTTDANCASAAEKNYKKRTDDPLGETPNISTFVFVTPHRWSGKEDWAKEKRAEGKWKEIVVYDADDLALWLEDCPAVLLDFKAKNSISTRASTLQKYWEDWSTATDPPTEAELVLAGRNEIREEITAWIRNHPSLYELQGNSVNESIAFLCAVLLQPTANPESERILDRCIVVNDSEDWERISQHKSPMVLIANQPNRDGLNRAISLGHHVFVPISLDEPTESASKLPRISSLAARSIIERVHGAGKVDQMSQAAQEGISVYRRQNANSRREFVPKWATPANLDCLLPIMLIVNWDDNNENDKKMVEKLSGMDYGSFISKLNLLCKEPDPPIRKISSIWTITSAKTSWELLYENITEDKLTLFHDIAIEVLSETDPKWNLADDQRWYARAMNAAPAYSETLRHGLCKGLAVMVSFESKQSSSSALLTGNTDWIVRDLLKKINTWQDWASIASNLPLIAEAAPIEFLSAVDKDLSSQDPVLLDLFQDNEYAMFSSSPHTGLLWALETLAWSNEHIASASLALAKLASIDPGGKLSNRPLNSLQRIFCTWHPYNSCSVDEMIRVLAMLRKNLPDISWSLNIGVLPSPLAMAHSIAKPHYRNWLPDQPGLITIPDSLRICSQCVNWLLEDVGVDGKRWKVLIESVRLLPDIEFDKVSNHLLSISLDQFNIVDQGCIWETARHLNSMYERTNKNDCLSNVQRRLVEVEERFLPSDPIERSKWLFGHDAWLSFYVSEENAENSQQVLYKHQQAAIVEVWDKYGLDGITRFSESIQRPDIVGRVIGESEKMIDDDLGFLITMFGREGNTSDQLALGFVHGRVIRSGQSWLDELLLSERINELSTVNQASLYLQYSAGNSLWDRLDSQPEEVRAEYWKSYPSWSHAKLSSAEFKRLVDSLVGVGRLIAAVDCVESRVRITEEKYPTNEIVNLLRAIVTHDPTSEHNIETQLTSYHILELLKFVESSGECTIGELAELQFAFLSLFQHNERHKPDALYEYLGEHPAMFIEFLCKIVGTETPSDEHYASEAEGSSDNYGHYYNVLQEWHLPPGLSRDGSVDSSRMNAWVDESRKLAVEVDRVNKADYLLGEIFSHMPSGVDGIWPHEDLRSLIERISNDKFERGLYIGKLNSRGIISRSPEEGGEQERTIADTYRGYSRSIALDFPRTSRLLERLAKSYEIDAKRHDDSRDLDWS